LIELWSLAADANPVSTAQAAGLPRQAKFPLKPEITGNFSIFPDLPPP
jgi:hypothetical protein